MEQGTALTTVEGWIHIISDADCHRREVVVIKGVIEPLWLLQVTRLYRLNQVFRNAVQIYGASYQSNINPRARQRLFYCCYNKFSFTSDFFVMNSSQQKATLWPLAAGTRTLWQIKIGYPPVSKLWKNHSWK